jgi:hypothetical protein
VGSVTRRVPACPDGLPEDALGVRAGVLEQDQRGQRGEGEGADHGVADQRSAADAGVPDAVVDDLDGVRLVVGAALDLVALVDLLVVRHERLGPVDGSRADPEQGQEQAGPRRMLDSSTAELDVSSRSGTAK